MPSRPLLALALGSLVLLAAPARAETVIPLDGDVPDDGTEFLLVPFAVPAGTKEIQIDHDDLSAANILDWGLLDESGKFRGWGGGNTEPAIVGELAASRSYLAGPLAVGSWTLVIGKAKIKELPAKYQVTVHLRDAPTLAAQTVRTPYVAVPALSKGPRWYAGDFHVHSKESGDAEPTLDAIAAYARTRGLDFVELSDHNTTSQLDYLGDAQSRHADLLFVPGVEFTTYHGHANGIGATAWVDHKIGLPGVTIEAAAKAFAAQGAIFSINHPALDLGDTCIGCSWSFDLDPTLLGAVEIATGGYSEAGHFVDGPAIQLWNKLVQSGHHIVAIGGSDDHSGGTKMGGLDSPIGSPTTLVFADELSVDALMKGIRAGRTVVKLQGPDDPMIDLTSSVAPEGDTVTAATTKLKAVITGGTGTMFHFVHNGLKSDDIAIDSDPFTTEIEAKPAENTVDRWRAEVTVKGAPRTITSHVWVKWKAAEVVTPEPAPAADAGCGCQMAPSESGGLWALGLAALGLARRRARFSPASRGSAGRPRRRASGSGM
ncbi:MAG: CehA/McbA family metallohydrolase [Byssovorax sp.]